MNHITRMVYDYIYEQINRDDEEVLEQLAENPQDYFENTYGEVRKSDDEIATYIWYEGYDNIEWRELGEAFKSVLDDVKNEKEEDETEDDDTDSEDE